MSQPYVPFIQKLAVRIHLVEMAMWLAVLVSVLLKFASVNTDLLILLSSFGLALSFFISAFRPVIPIAIGREQKEGEKLEFMDLLSLVIVPKVLWLSSAVSALGILFWFLDLNRQGHMQMLLVGAISIGVCLVLLVPAILRGTRHAQTVLPILFRAVPLMLMSIYLLMYGTKLN